MAEYQKIIQWSDEDQVFIGTCPELFFGGVHGKNEMKVYRELCTVVKEWEALARKKSNKRRRHPKARHTSGRRTSRRRSG